jgi:hypothetical protein
MHLLPIGESVVPSSRTTKPDTNTFRPEIKYSIELVQLRPSGQAEKIARVHRTSFKILGACDTLAY